MELRGRRTWYLLKKNLNVQGRKYIWIFKSRPRPHTKLPNFPTGNYKLMFRFYLLTINVCKASFMVLLNSSSCAQCTVKPNKLKSRSLGQRKIYPRALQGDRWLMSQNPQTPHRVSAKHLKK